MQKRGSYSQTLDELLGLTNKPAPSQSQVSSRTTSTYPERPATRHGRSSGSNTASSSGKGSSPEHIQNPSPDAISKSSSRIDVWSRDENDSEAVVEPPVVDKPPKSTPESPVAKNRSMSTDAFRKKPSVILERRESLSSVSSRSTAASSSTPASSNKSGGGTHRIDTADAVASATILPQADSKQVLPSEVNGRRMSLQQKTAADKAVFIQLWNVDD
ncbi:hypothetical protein AAVH_01250 [Aphelenchoides avenae]|nr:hypothetical protein AAVH_01250 [Aphelenchus avenae]